MEGRTYHYIKNGKPFQSPEPLFSFIWTCGEKGTAEFGTIETQSEYDAECVLERFRRPPEFQRKLKSKTPLEEYIWPL